MLRFVQAIGGKPQLFGYIISAFLYERSQDSRFTLKALVAGKFRRDACVHSYCYKGDYVGRALNGLNEVLIPGKLFMAVLESQVWGSHCSPYHALSMVRHGSSTKGLLRL